MKEKLDPRRKVFIEYSNEVWNSMFRQHRDAGLRGQKLGLAEKPWEAAWKYTGVRSSEIFSIVATVFGGHDRRVRVVGTQSVVPYISEQILNAGDCAEYRRPCPRALPRLQRPPREIPREKPPRPDSRGCRPVDGG